MNAYSGSSHDFQRCLQAGTPGRVVEEEIDSNSEDEVEEDEDHTYAHPTPSPRETFKLRPLQHLWPHLTHLQPLWTHLTCCDHTWHPFTWGPFRRHTNGDWCQGCTTIVIIIQDRHLATRLIQSQHSIPEQRQLYPEPTTQEKKNRRLCCWRPISQKVFRLQKIMDQCAGNVWWSLSFAVNVLCWGCQSAEAPRKWKRGQVALGLGLVFYCKGNQT